jgi:hypothetical protein
MNEIIRSSLHIGRQGRRHRGRQNEICPQITQISQKKNQPPANAFLGFLLFSVFQHLWNLRNLRMNPTIVLPQKSARMNRPSCDIVHAVSLQYYV